VKSVLLKFISPILVIAVFCLDRVTKSMILAHFSFGESLRVLPFFDLTHYENTGIAFGIGQEKNRIFIALSSVLIIILLFLRRRWEKEHSGNMLLKIGLALVIGGALGNLYDRIVYKSVIDFLLFHIGEYQWPAFNVADSAICTGAFFLLFAHWREGKTPRSPEAAA